MNSFKQIKLATIDSPLSLRFMRKNSLRWGAVYSFSTFVVFSLFIWVMLSNQQVIKTILLDYLFPESWQSVSEQLADFLFESQTKVVVSNLILSGSLVLASIVLFPVKEKFSAEFERDANYCNGSVNEFPLILQAWEETKLFLLYLTAQSVILWIGYYPYQSTTILSIVLSYLFLFFTFGLDIISPTLQRHRINYSLMLKFLMTRPLLTISFGLLYSLPLIIISYFVFDQSELTLVKMTGILFIANIIFLSLAIPAGTHIASKILPQIKKTPQPNHSNVRNTYLVLSVLLIASLYLHSRLVVSLHHKSQLLKAEYNLDWSSITFDLPSLSQLANGKALSNFSVDIVINNPTEFDIIIEPSEIHIEQDRKLIATLNISGFNLLSGEKERINLKLNSKSNLNLVNDFDRILDNWRVDMYIDIWPGIPFMINIVSDQQE